MQALNQAIVCAKETTGVVHHLDHDSQGGFNWLSQHPEHGIIASTETVGDSYDNALAENVNGYYKNELIHTWQWNDVVDVEIATCKWVTWWNQSRLHQSLGLRTPTEIEAEFLDEHPRTRNNRNQGKCLGQNLGHSTVK